MTLDMLDASVVAEWVEGYLGNLKDRGELDGFCELIVMENDDSDFRRKVSYLGNEALDWCSSIRRSEQVRYAFQVFNSILNVYIFGDTSDSRILNKEGYKATSLRTRWRDHEGRLTLDIKY